MKARTPKSEIRPDILSNKQLLAISLLKQVTFNENDDDVRFPISSQTVTA